MAVTGAKKHFEYDSDDEVVYDTFVMDEELPSGLAKHGDTVQQHVIYFDSIRKSTFRDSKTKQVDGSIVDTSSKNLEGIMTSRFYEWLQKRRDNGELKLR